MEYMVVGEGRKTRFYLTHWYRSRNEPDMPRFARGQPGRAKAMKFKNKLDAERAASHAQDVDRWNLEWHAVVCAPTADREFSADGWGEGMGRLHAMLDGK